jgi:hypothetical protein
VQHGGVTGTLDQCCSLGRWKDITRLVTEDKTVEDQAVQVNYDTTLEATLSLLDRQDERILAAHARAAKYLRCDSVLNPSFFLA